MFDPIAPIDPDVLASWLAPPGASQAETNAAADRLRKNQPFAGEPDRTFRRPAARAPALAGEPVSLFTGTLTMSIVDLVVPTAGTPIRFERSYRSGRPYFGPFGFGWDHCYNVYLRPLHDGAMAFWAGLLREWTFHPVGAGWEPEQGLTVRLEPTGIPDSFDVVHSGGLRWRFEQPPGWSDGERIPLTMITDRHNNRVQLSYDNQNRLNAVLDESNRGLFFHYGQCGLLEQISDHTETRVVRYEHHNEREHLVRVVLPATAQFPKGITTTYEYDFYAAHPAMRSNILRIIDSDGRTYLENEYAGPEVGWAFNTVTRQIIGGFEYLFEYEQLQYVPANAIYVDVPASRTSVRTPDGGVYVHTFNYRGDLIDHRYRLNRDGTYRVVASQFVYDAHGNITKAVAPDGQRQVMKYDDSNPDPCARRNLLRVDIAAGLPGLAVSRTLRQTRYDPRYQLPIHTTDEAGKVTRYVYDFNDGVPNATGRLTRVELPPVARPGGSQHSIIHFEHNSRGQVTAVVSPEGSRGVMEYITSGGFDDGMLDRTIGDATGAALTTTYAYDAVGHPSRITDPAGYVTELGHNALGQLEKVVPPAVGGVTSPVRTWFGDDGSPVRIERPRGDYTDSVITEPFLADVFERDVLGRLTASHLAVNTEHPRTSQQRLDHEGRPIRMIDPTGAITERRYDERGALILETRSPGTPEESITRYTYDRTGRLTHVKDAAGWETRIHPDKWGRVLSVELPGGATRTNTWGRRDLLLKTTEERSPGPGLPSQLLTAKTYKYDERGRVTAQTTWSFVDAPGPAIPPSAVPLTTRTTYDKDDRIRKVELPRGATTVYDYDGLGRLTRVTDPNGTTRDHHYNAAGDLDKETVTESEGGVLRRASSTFEYDERGRLHASESPTGRTEVDYDDRDALVERREPGNVTSTITTNPFGEITSTRLDPGGLNIYSQWTYDDAGRISTFTDPTGAITTWEHDELGRVHKLTLPGGATWQYTYDVVGRRIEQTMPSGTRVTQTLNAHGQPSKLECTAVAGVDPVPPHEFVYDVLGRLISAELPAGAVERRYDSVGRLIQETARGETIRLSYNDVSGDIDLEFPDGRRELTHHDATGRPTSVTLETPGAALGGIAGDILAAIEYAGHPTKIAHSNGVDTTLTYDRPGRLVSIEHSRAGVLLDGYRARYDERNRRAVVQLTGNPTRNTLHDFDARDRLTQARWGFPLAPLPEIAAPADHTTAITAAKAAATAAAATTTTETYILDQADARKRRTRTAAGAAPSVDINVLGPDHRIVTAAGNPITHHPDGPRATDTHQNYDIDALGRIVRVRDATTGAVTAEFTYDALSRVATGSLAGTPFMRSFLGTTWIQETRGGVGEVRQTTPHPLWPQPLSVTDSANTLFIHPDEGLSTLCITDAAGTVQERHRYGPFGTPELFEGDGVTPVAPVNAVPEPRWRGMPLNSGIGLYTSTQRLYDPAFGLFLAPDPLLYVDSPSQWVFATHNPVDFTDYTGFAKTPVRGGQREPIFDDSWARSHQAAGALDNKLWEDAQFDKAIRLDLPPSEVPFDWPEAKIPYSALYMIKHDVWNPFWDIFLQKTKVSNVAGVRVEQTRNVDRTDAFVKLAQFVPIFIPGGKVPALEGGLLDYLGLGRSSTQLLRSGGAAAADELPTLARSGGSAAADDWTVFTENRSLHHFTNEEGLNAILETGQLNPSLKALNPKDARYGNGAYLSDIIPGTASPGSLSQSFLRRPYWGRRFSHYVEIDVIGLEVVRGREGVFLVPNEGPLNIADRIRSFGEAN
ncbi:HYD1 signature containing ADP-ribosyltransferase family protein [Rhodococcus opacus]|uniref:HYD1 signature containing ADP-ribosyltransferase family protein n=1 Tax=Rhodococcus opacus TaxID=37919 RepID=UPI002476A4FB|nr:HYD1 signature containing ADP-ribosyltransferase family protein [Rhodococcus opacus]MDH6291872.1 RHS repeat-associated protein [Rhodococcus opacus]